MARKIKIRAKVNKGLADIKCLVSHPMETGNRKDKKTGNTIPPHFIEEVQVAINGATVINANINGTVSRNPYFRFKAKASSGDKVKISWVDNKGETSSQEAEIE